MLELLAEFSALRTSCQSLCCGQPTSWHLPGVAENSLALLLRMPAWKEPVSLIWSIPIADEPASVRVRAMRLTPEALKSFAGRCAVYRYARRPFVGSRERPHVQELRQRDGL